MTPSLLRITTKTLFLSIIFLQGQNFEKKKLPQSWDEWFSSKDQRRICHEVVLNWDPGSFDIERITEKIKNLFK